MTLRRTAVVSLTAHAEKSVTALSGGPAFGKYLHLRRAKILSRAARESSSRHTAGAANFRFLSRGVRRSASFCFHAIQSDFPRITRLSSSNSRSGTIGFATCPFIPASRHFRTSSAKASAVMAMMGTVLESGLSSFRTARVASIPVHHRHPQIHQDRVEIAQRQRTANRSAPALPVFRHIDGNAALARVCALAIS
jgi:hypothetical protein